MGYLKETLLMLVVAIGVMYGLRAASDGLFRTAPSHPKLAGTTTTEAVASPPAAANPAVGPASTTP